MPLLGETERAREIRRNMLALKIYEKDIEEKFIRSSGPGGQNVNKVATCVMLYHRLSGFRVKAQEGRTQGLNRLKARERLCQKVERSIWQKALLKKSEKAKKKRQNRKRSKASKEKMLEKKKQQSQIKKSRQKIRDYE